MDKYVQYCSRQATRLRSASAPVIRDVYARADGLLAATSSDRLMHRRKSVRGQCPGMPSRSHSAQVQSSCQLTSGPHGDVPVSRRYAAQDPIDAQQPTFQRHGAEDQLAIMAENALPALGPEAKGPLIGVHAPEPSHGPLTRSRAAHNGALQPIATCSNSPIPLPMSHAGPPRGNIGDDGNKGGRDSWSKRRVMGTSLSADQTLSHRSPCAPGRRLRSPHANDHLTTACTRRRSDSPGAAFCMDTDRASEGVNANPAPDGRASPSRSGCKQHRTPLRKQNTNVMKALRSSRQPLPRTRSAGHAYKLRSRSRPQAPDHDDAQSSQCDTY